MIAPEVPAGGAEGQAVLDDQTDGQVDDAMGVVAAGWGEVGRVGVEVFAAAGAVVLGVSQADVVGPPGEEIAEVMEGALELAIAVGAVPTAGTGPAFEVAAASEDLGRGEVLDAGDAFGRVGTVFSRAWHGSVLLIGLFLSTPISAAGKIINPRTAVVFSGR
jgi:hypothetical protein